MNTKQTKIWAIKVKLGGNNKLSWYKIKVLFSIDPNSDNYCLFKEESDEFIKARWLFTEETIDKYNNKIISYSDLLNERIKDSYYQMKEDNLFSYNHKTNIFTFGEYVSNCPTVLGALDELRLIKDCEDYSKLPHRFKVEHIILSTLQTLHLFWD